MIRLVALEEPYLELSQSWLASTIGGEPAVTEGTLTLTQYENGDWLLEVSSGDENHPAHGRGGEGWASVQMPLKREYADLVVRALRGQRLGDVDHRGR